MVELWGLSIIVLRVLTGVSLIGFVMGGEGYFGPGSGRPCSSWGGDAFQHGGKARPAGDRVRARHGSVVILADDLEASPAGEGLDGFPLAPVAALVGTDVRGARGAQIRNRLDRFSCALLSAGHGFQPLYAALRYSRDGWAQRYEQKAAKALERAAAEHWR